MIVAKERVQLLNIIGIMKQGTMKQGMKVWHAEEAENNYEFRQDNYEME
jgi:hypothetical protein